MIKCLTVVIMAIVAVNVFSSDWRRIDIGLEEVDNTRLYYLDSTTAFFIKPFSGEVAYSEDGGNQWIDVYDAPVSGSPFGNYVYFNGSSGYVIFKELGEKNKSLARWWNFGRNYEIINEFSDELLSPVSRFFMLDDDTGYLAIPFDEGMGQMGTYLYKTVNSGEKWEKRETFVLDNLLDIVMVDEDNVFTVFSSGKVKKSDALSTDWHTIELKANTKNAFQMLSSSEGFSAHGKSVYHTQDGGLTSSIILEGDEEPFSIRAISVLDNKTLWAAFRNGKIYKTRDGGITWQTDSLDIEYNNEFEILDIQALDFDKAIVNFRSDISSDKGGYFGFSKNFSGKTSKIEDLIDDIIIYSSGNEVIFEAVDSAEWDILVCEITGKIAYESKQEVVSGSKSIKINGRGIYYLRLRNYKTDISKVLYLNTN